MVPKDSDENTKKLYAQRHNQQQTSFLQQGTSTFTKLKVEINPSFSISKYSV